MEYFVATESDAGIKRAVNQDALFVKEYAARGGNVVFAVLCDGMGGLQYGEIASASVIEAFSSWADRVLPMIDAQDLEDHFVRKEWTDIISEENQKLRLYGQNNNCVVGSTVTALLLTESRYYVLNIGDSRAYQIGDEVKQLTEDHTVIAEEIRKGNMSEAQASASPMKSVLTRCIGVSAQVYPDLFFGEPKAQITYLLCSDGFRHKISPDEMKAHLLPDEEQDPQQQLETGIHTLIELNMSRMETDNISAIGIYLA